LGVPIETKTYELTGFPASTGSIHSVEELRAATKQAKTLAHHASPDGGLQKRIVELVRHFYCHRANLVGPPLPLGSIDGLALPYETLALAFPTGQLGATLGAKLAKAMLAEGGYRIEQDGTAWVSTGRQVFDAAKSYLPVQAIDAFGEVSSIEYPSHALLVTSVTDPPGTVTAENDLKVDCRAAVIAPSPAPSIRRARDPPKHELTDGIGFI
jgi:hypothetical protein